MGRVVPVILASIMLSFLGTSMYKLEKAHQKIRKSDKRAAFELHKLSTESSVATAILAMQVLERNEEENKKIIALLQAETTLKIKELIQLQFNESVLSIKDPCEAGPGYNQLLFKTANNLYVFSLQTPGLQILTDNTYVTEDTQNCTFQVVEGQWYE